MPEQNEYQTRKTNEIPRQEISDPSVLAKNPVVSVGMITYNHEPYIAQAIESVLMQETNFPIELIIGEDCSTDRTREIVLEYQKKYPEIIRVVTSDSNVGMWKNGWRTAMACRGEYRANCEGDDYWTDPHKLQKQVAFFGANPDVVMVAHRAHKVDVNGNIKSTFPAAQSAHLRPRDIIIKGGGFFSTNSVIIKKSLLQKLPDWYYAFPVGDSALMNLAIQRGTIGFINDVMSAYRMNVPGSWSSRIDTSKKLIIHVIGVDRAYGRLMRQEREYTIWYCMKRLLLYWRIVTICIKAVLKFALSPILRR